MDGRQDGELGRFVSRPLMVIPMNDRARHICRSVESVSKALAEWTVSAQFDSDGTVMARYGEGARRRWVADTQTRITHLAQSMAVRCPELFCDCVLCASDAFRARGADRSDLALNLQCLRDVIAAELPEAVTESALPCLEQALTALSQESVVDPATRAPALAHGPHDSLMHGYLEDVLHGRAEAGVERILEAARRGVPVADLYASVLQCAMHEIGRRWQADEISVADEHCATFATQMAMSRLRQHFPKRPSRGVRLLACAAAGDLHEIGVRMIADFFAMDGWQTHYLGANLPIADLVKACIDRDIHVAAISATGVSHLASLGGAIEALRAAQECDAVRVLVGGPPFNRIPALWREVGADGFARDAAEAVAVGNRLVADAASRA